MTKIETSLDLACKNLRSISITLEKINMKFAEFLNLKRPLVKSDPPSLTVCGACFQEIHGNDQIITCEHAHLCEACAPCDQCE